MANKVYVAKETALTFADSAQTPTANLTLSALGAGSGRVSARHDLGASSVSRLYEWRATFQMGTAGVVGETIDIYLSTSDGTNPDGEEGTADAALSSTNKLKNMQYIGSVSVDTTSTNTDITSSGFCEINSRYFSVVVHNNTADALKTDTAVHGVKLTPVPDEVQ